MGLSSLILWTPAAGALCVACLPAARPGLIRRTALVATALPLLLLLAVLAGFDPQAGVQYAESLPWNPSLGTRYALGVDGLSLPMLLLGSALCLVAVIASVNQRERLKGYFGWLLMLEFGLLGVFLARDWALFYLYWELTLIPLFFLIDRWGGARRHLSSLNFVLYTMGGAVFLLVVLLYVFRHTDHSTAMDAMAQAGRGLSPTAQTVLLGGLLLGFGVKMPIVPLHGWLPLAHVEAPSPISILLSGILLKMGAYGLLRALEMLPAGFSAWQPVLAALAFAGILYGALVAWRQTDLKAMIAYGSVSHMGVVLLGIATLSPTGLQGAVMQMTAHGLGAASLFLVAGLLYEQTRTRRIADYRGLVQRAPRCALLLSLALVASIGLPGFGGFIAELHAFVGGVERFGGWVLLASLGVLVTAAYALRTAGVLLGGQPAALLDHSPDLRRAPYWAACALAGGSVLLGIVPAPWLRLSETAASRLVALPLPAPDPASGGP